MALTLWRRYVICQQCGAQRPVDDATAIAGACQYCGSPAPDVPHVARAPRAGGIAVTIGLLVVVALAVAWSLGWLDRLVLDLGPSGVDARHLAERRARAVGYKAVVGAEASGQHAAPTLSLTLHLATKRCYALAIGSGRRLRRVTLARAGRRLLDDEVARRWALSTFCPPQAGRYRATITLERPGRVSWRLLQRIGEQ